jgi:hypothetical protein
MLEFPVGAEADPPALDDTIIWRDGFHPVPAVWPFKSKERVSTFGEIRKHII